MSFKTALVSAGTKIVESKHTPTVLTIGGVIGIGVTVVLACRATLKAQEIVAEQQAEREALDQNKNLEKGSKEYTKELAKVYGETLLKMSKLYALPVSIGVLSVAGILGSHKIMSDRNVKLAASLSTLSAAYNQLNKFTKDYRKRVVDAEGIDKDMEYAFGLTKDKSETVDADGKKVSLKDTLHTKDGISKKDISDFEKINPNILVFDERSGEYKNSPAANMTFLKAQQNYWNDTYRRRRDESLADGKKRPILLNEVITSLGFEPTKAGAQIGWDPTDDTSDGFIEFHACDFKYPQNKLFANGYASACVLEFNTDGTVFDRIDEPVGYLAER